MPVRKQQHSVNGCCFGVIEVNLFAALLAQIDAGKLLLPQTNERCKWIF
jgi:hypothetical protein